MATNRTLWKGAISFGLVHTPVGLHTATTEQGVDFDWLDSRTMDPVGYKRINKRTGKESGCAQATAPGRVWQSGRGTVWCNEKAGFQAHALTLPSGATTQRTSGTRVSPRPPQCR